MATAHSTDKFIDIQGGQVFVRTWSNDHDAKCPIVLLHDSLGCVDTWRDFPYKLSQHLNRSVFAYDRLGFGKSSARTALPTLGFIEDESHVVEKLTDALELNQFILFGYSVGGAMSLVAAKSNSRCKAVISVSAQAYIEERTREGILKAKQFYADPAHFEKLRKYHGDNTEWVFKAWTETWLGKDFQNWSLLTHLPDVLCPVLVIHGDQDEYGSLAFADGIATTVAGFSKKIIVADCGHIPHREHEAKVLAEIKTFVDHVCP